MCQDCREQGIARKIAQFEEPKGIRKRLRKADKSKGRKVRLDELTQATKDYWKAFESEERHKADAAACPWKDQGHKKGPWVCLHGMDRGWLKSQTKKLDQIYEACRKDGII